MPLPLAVPLIVGGALAAGGVIGSAASGALGKSKHVNKYGVDRTNYTYGGAPDFAEAMRRRLQASGQDAGKRNVLSGTDATDYRAGIADYRAGMGDYRTGLEGYQAAQKQQQQARAEQMQQLSALSRAAMPGAESAGQQQMRAGTEDAALNALNVAATGRGGAAAGASMAALDANVLGAQRANRDGAILAVQERAQARGELAGLTSAIRQGDMEAMQAEQGYARLGQDAARLGQGLSGLGMQQQGIELQQQELELRQMGLNDEQIRAYLQSELAVNRDELQGSMAYGQADLQAGLQAQQLNAQLEEAARQRKAAFWGGMFKAGAGIAGLGMGGGGAGPPLGAYQGTPNYEAMVDAKYAAYMR
jgi:DNA-binding transcriptional MerR regulator